MSEATAATIPAPEAAHQGVDDLDSEFSAAVTRLYRRLRAEKARDQFGESHRTVLALLVKQGPRTLRDLSEHEHVTPPSMNQTVNALAKAGLVARQSDPDDGRKVILVATPQGEALIAETRRRWHEWLSSRLQELTVEERQVLASATGIIERIAEA